MRRLRFAFFWMPAFLASSALAEGTGELRGRVLERASGSARPLVRETVQLEIYKSDFQVAGARTTTDAQGRYRFAGLDTGPQFAYQVSARPTSVPFKSAPLWFGGKTGLEAADIIVTPVTGKPDHLEAEALYMVRFAQDGLLDISESLSFVNRGETAYDPRADGGVPIELSLPDGGFDLSLGAGLGADTAEVISEKNTLEIKPQVQADPETPYRAEYAYRMPYAEKTLPLSFKTSIPVTRVTLVLVERNAKVESSLLKFQEKHDADGKVFFLYSGGPVKAGEALSFTLGGLPLPGVALRIWMFVGIGLAACAAVALGLRGAKKPRATDFEALAAEAFRRLADLETRFKRGEAELPEYRNERLRLRELLFDLEMRTKNHRAA